MDNGVEIVDGSYLGKKKSVEDGVSGDKVEEKVAVGSDESNDSKDLEGDEVFEEAMDTNDHLQELGAISGSGDGVVVSDGVVEVSGDSGLVVVDENENSNVGNEGEKFEEVPAILSEFGNHEGVVEGKVECLVGGESVDGVDEGGTKTEGVKGESNGLGDDGLGANGEDNGKEVSKDGASEESENLKGGIERGEESGGVIEKPVFSDHKGGTNGVVPHENGESGELKERDLYTEHQDDRTGELKDASGGLDSEFQDVKGEELNDNLEKMDAESKNDESGELKGSTAGLDSGQDDKVEELRDVLANLEAEDQVYELGDSSTDMHTPVKEGTVTPKIESSPSSENSAIEKKEKILAGENVHEVSSNHAVPEEPENVHERRGASANLDAEHHVDGSGEMKDTSAALDPEYVKQIYELGDSSASTHTPVKEGSVTPEIESSPSSETSAIEKNEKILAGENVHEVSSNHAVSEEPEKKGAIEKNEKILAGENVHEVSRNHAVSEEPEKKGAKVVEEKQSTQVSREREIQPEAMLGSSSGKSTNPSSAPARPAGLGRAAPLLEPAPRVVQQPRVNGTVSPMQSQQIEDPTNGEAEEYDETREKLQMIRVKFLRLAHRLGQTPHNVVVAQVLYRLGLAEQLRGRNGGRVGAFSFDRASAMAEQLEAAGQEPLDFSCTIMVLGKTGVGKSATINSIFDEIKFSTDAFQMGTKKVQDVVGTVQGIKVRVIDTPGLLPSWSDQRQNEKILHSVKRFIKKTPPDIVLYLDRLDMQTRDFGDMPLLRTITEIFGPSIWFNAIVVLTHAASAPPDGPNGTASSYDMFVTQRSHVVQQAIRQAAGDMRLMNPVSLVENHSACRTNRAGQRVLPNGQVWKPHLLLLSFASKILAEANTLLKLQDTPPGQPFATRSRAPPLPFLLSSLLQSRPQLKLPEEQFGDEDGLDDDLDDSSDSDDESEYDELPPFKRLTKAQVAKLTKAQKKAYVDELEYREKLFMKKQLKEEKRRRKMMKKMAASAKDMPSDYSENAEEESGSAASVPVPMPDLALPASFDSDNPTHRYRYLDSSNQWLVRPVLETHGWDHDVGYEGINIERLFVVKEKMPLSFSGQVTKDKKDANVQMEVASSVKHGEGKATSLGFDMQTIGKDMAYTLRSETRFSNYRKNKATAGLSATLLGGALSGGVKIEDKLIVNKRFRMVMTGGAMTGRGDVAYGGSLEAQLRDKDYPLGRSLSTLGLSVMDWHGDLAVGCNIQSQIPVGRSTNLIARGNLNNRGSGQVSIRLNSSEQLQIALIGLIPLLKKLLGYPQQMQFGQ